MFLFTTRTSGNSRWPWSIQSLHGASCKISPHGESLMMRKVKDQPRSTQEDLVNDLKRGPQSETVTFSNTLCPAADTRSPWSVPVTLLWIIQRVMWLDETKIKPFEINSKQDETPLQLWSMWVETSCFGGVLLQKQWLQRIEERRDRAMYWVILDNNLISSVRSLKMGRSSLIIYDLKHTARANKEWLLNKHFKTWTQYKPNRQLWILKDVKKICIWSRPNKTC